MAKTFTYRLFTFDSADASVMTGASANSQRDWRRMGYLPKVKGHARYDLYDLCELWILQACAVQGYGPKRAKSFSRSAATHMAWQTLLLLGAYKGEKDSGGHLDAPLSRHNVVFELQGKDYPTPPWGRKARWLADQIVLGNDIDDAPLAKFYGVWPDDSAMPFNDDYALSVIGTVDPEKRGAVIILPLESAAKWMLEAAARHPFVEVAFE